MFPHRNLDSKSPVLANDNNSISESDDDVTPQASPHHSPYKTQDHAFLPTTRSQFLDTNNYPNQNFAKRVTFAKHISPKTNQAENGIENPSRHFEATLYSTVNDNGFKTSQPSSEQWTSDGDQKCRADYASETCTSEDYVIDDHTRFNGTYPGNVLKAEVPDKDFPMRKFLEHSRHFSSDENETESSDVSSYQKPTSPYTMNRTSANQRNLFTNVYNSHQVPHHNTTAHLANVRNQNHINSRTQLFPSGTSQDVTFQGSILDGSVSSIDCTSTQSSVTSQYEAQFQLGLANLDSEIAKLQSSLKSMGTS